MVALVTVNCLVAADALEFIPEFMPEVAVAEVAVAEVAVPGVAVSDVPEGEAPEPMLLPPSCPVT